jgi:hypothetical protein
VISTHGTVSDIRNDVLKIREEIVDQVFPVSCVYLVDKGDILRAS